MSNSENPQELLNRGIRLLEAGDADGAKMLLLQAADAGIAQAYLNLANQAFVEGRKEQAQSFVEKMEELACANDPIAHLCCHFAYETLLGVGSPREQREKSNYH